MEADAGLMTYILKEPKRLLYEKWCFECIKLIIKGVKIMLDRKLDDNAIYSSISCAYFMTIFWTLAATVRAAGVKRYVRKQVCRCLYLIGIIKWTAVTEHEHDQGDL